jgi:RNA polymerase sigma-70 factor (ECF subfamily)
VSEPPAHARDGAAPDDDWALLARAGVGDGAAFTGLVERHQERLLQLCERLLGSRDDALDAGQEVFLKVYRHAARAQPRGQFFTWLYRIAVNHCLNLLRRRKVVRFLSLGATGSPDEGDGSRLLEPASPEPSAQAQLESRERWRRTRRALARLPESQRVVVVLAKFEGLSQKEIAAALAISEGAVESRLVRAMRQLVAAQEEPGPWVSTRRTLS